MRSILTQFAPFSEPNPRDPGQLRKAHKIAQWRTNSSLYDQADTEPISSARDGRPLVFSASKSSADPRNWRRDRVLRPRPTFPYLRGAPQRNARRCPRNLIFQNPESSAWQPRRSQKTVPRRRGPARKGGLRLPGGKELIIRGEERVLGDPRGRGRPPYHLRGAFKSMRHCTESPLHGERYRVCL